MADDTPDDLVRRRRKNPPEALKIFVVANQDGRCACRDKQRFSFEPCGKHLLEDGNTKVHFNHDPPLELRTWDEDKRDWDIPQHDPDYLFAVREDCHKRMTNGRGAGGGGRGTDIGEIARLKRQKKRRKEEADLKRKKDEAARNESGSGSGSIRSRALVQTRSARDIAREAGGPAANMDAPPETAAPVRGFGGAARKGGAGWGKRPMQGGGSFRTGKDSPYKAKIGGGVVRRDQTGSETEGLETQEGGESPALQDGLETKDAL